MHHARARDITAHRHKSEQPPPTLSPTLPRKAATMSAGEDSPSFYFLDTILTAAQFIFSTAL